MSVRLERRPGRDLLLSRGPGCGAPTELAPFSSGGALHACCPVFSLLHHPFFIAIPHMGKAHVPLAIAVLGVGMYQGAGVAIRDVCLLE